jgi:hypothetical protein
MLNLATGIMINLVVDSNGDKIFDKPEYRSGLDYDEKYTEGFTGQLNQSITPDGAVEDRGNAIYRVLDTLSLGFVERFLNAVDNYMFGFINVLNAVIISKMTGEASTFIIGILKTILTIGYMVAAWVMWTGKDIRS